MLFIVLGKVLWKSMYVTIKNQKISGLKIVHNNMVTTWGYYESYL